KETLPAEEGARGLGDACQARTEHAHERQHRSLVEHLRGGPEVDEDGDVGLGEPGFVVARHAEAECPPHGLHGFESNAGAIGDLTGCQRAALGEDEEVAGDGDETHLACASSSCGTVAPRAISHSSNASCSKRTPAPRASRIATL